MRLIKYVKDRTALICCLDQTILRWTFNPYYKHVLNLCHTYTLLFWQKLRFFIELTNVFNFSAISGLVNTLYPAISQQYFPSPYLNHGGYYPGQSYLQNPYHSGPMTSYGWPSMTSYPPAHAYSSYSPFMSLSPFRPFDPHQQVVTKSVMYSVLLNQLLDKVG